MLNLSVGSRVDLAGHDAILTSAGARGHAVYGPYAWFDRGRYAVEFTIRLAGDGRYDADAVCATVEVVSAGGDTVFASADILISALDGARRPFALEFELPTRQSLEFRVEAAGVVPLIIADERPVIALPDGVPDTAAYLESLRFPDHERLSGPAFFLDNLAMFRELHERGARIRFAGAGTIVEISGIAFHANSDDDLAFVGEVLFEDTYNLLVQRDVCVIDVGTNIGLAALNFARRDFVKEVHAFEPFKATHDRALANFALNPGFSGKITLNNYGLAGADSEVTVPIAPGVASGSFSMARSGEGEPVRIAIRDAAPVFARIIAGARAKRLDVVAKIDCEGAEFPIFDSLAAAGLLGGVCAFMVESHGGGGRFEHELIDPLLKAGFTVFSRPSSPGNRFFYAVRSARRSFWAR